MPCARSPPAIPARTSPAPALARECRKHQLAHRFPDTAAGAEHNRVAPKVLQEVGELHLILDRPNHDSKICGSVHAERILRARDGYKTRACPQCSPGGKPGC